jgi:hypothetical protein
MGEGGKKGRDGGGGRTMPGIAEQERYLKLFTVPVEFTALFTVYFPSGVKY